MSRIVLVFGGRYYANYGYVVAVLNRLHAEDPFRLLLEGGAPGADYAAREWAETCGVPHITVYALWDVYGKSAGPKRNRNMATARPDLAIGFPGGAGTADMERVCREFNIPLYLAHADSTTPSGYSA
jgi:hypothetical protein